MPGGGPGSLRAPGPTCSLAAQEAGADTSALELVPGAGTGLVLPHREQEPLQLSSCSACVGTDTCVPPVCVCMCSTLPG